MLALKFDDLQNILCFEGNHSQISGKKVLNIPPVLAQSGQQRPVLTQLAGRIGGGQPETLRLLHHAAMAELRHGDGRDKAAKLSIHATGQKPPALFGGATLGVNDHIGVQHDGAAVWNVIQIHCSQTSDSMLALNCCGVRGKSGSAKSLRKPAGPDGREISALFPPGSRIVSKAFALGGSASAFRARTRPCSNSTSTVL
jgi:hypothetical protein